MSRLRTHSLARNGLSLVLTVLFLYLAFRGTDVVGVARQMRDANYLWMAVSVSCLVASHMLRALRWRYFLAPVKQQISFRNACSGVMIGYFVNNMLPRVGEIVRPYTMTKLEQVPVSAAFGTIVVERLIDMVSFLVLVAAIPFVYHGPLNESFPWLARSGMIISWITFVSLALLIGLMLRRDWTDMLVRWIVRLLPEKAGASAQRLAHSFLDGFMFLKRPRQFLVIGVLSALIWVLYILMMYTAFFSFGLQDRLDLGAALVVQAISSIGVAIPTPGATGGYHAFTSQTLARLYHLDQTAALGFATLTHAAGFVVVSVIGLYFFLHDHIRVTDARASTTEELS